MRVTGWQAALGVGVTIVALASVIDTALRAAPSIEATAVQSQIIDHLTPRRDSRGPQPKRLEWTAVKGADSYAVGIWNEVDVRVLKVGNLKSTSVDWPAGLELDAGTYFWSIMAFQDDRPIADSGLAAFIVVR